MSFLIKGFAFVIMQAHHDKNHVPLCFLASEQSFVPLGQRYRRSIYLRFSQILTHNAKPLWCCYKIQL